MFSPQLASPLDLTHIGMYVVNDDWVLEQKLDGHRIALILRQDKPPLAITRNGTHYTRKLPAAIQALRSTQAPDDSPFIIDGELVGLSFWAFDLLREDGSMNKMPLTDRRALLEHLTAGEEHLKLVPQARTTEEKERLLLHAAETFLEGVVAKRASSTYIGRRSRDWLKAKFVCTADVVVLAVRDDGKESASLGIHDASRWFEIGRCSLLGKPPVEVGDVVEVAYLYVQHPEAPRLYQPNLIRVRKDKNPIDCDGADFRMTNKRVLDSLP